MVSQKAYYYKKKKGTGGRKIPSKSRRSTSSAYYRGLRDGSRSARLSLIRKMKRASREYAKKGDEAKSKGDRSVALHYWARSSALKTLIDDVALKVRKSERGRK